MSILNTQRKDEKSAYATALLRSLQFSGVKFLRYFTVDICNNIRCKVKPVDQLLKSETLDNQVSVAECCYGGLPPSADILIEGTGMMSARNVLTIQPDLQSFRNLPYAPTSAVVIGNLIDQYNNEPSPLDTREVLSRMVRYAAEKYNISISVGAELEFCLVDAKTGNFVDNSVFANTITLNEQEDFLSDLYDQLQQQHIPIELIHSESGPGQVEFVLQYSNDPVTLADNVILAKETIRAVARKYGHKALFIPKYDMTKAGNGMHVHMSIRDATTGQPIFCNGSSLTEKGASFVEGILRHLPGLLGLTLPTVNSFRRVGPGCWTGSKVGWDLEDKEVGVRVCSNLATKEWDHVELKLCDSTSNLYLVLAALLGCGLEGISENWTLRPSLRNQDKANDRSTPLPASVEEALDALENDPSIVNILGPRVTKAHLALRRYEVEQHKSSTMTVEDEVKAALARA